MEKGKFTKTIGLIANVIAVTTGIVACHYSQKFIFEKFGVEPLQFYQSFIVTYALAFLAIGIRVGAVRKAEK